MQLGGSERPPFAPAVERHRLALCIREQQERAVGAQHVGERVEEIVGRDVGTTHAGQQRLEPQPQASLVQGAIEDQRSHGPSNVAQRLTG